MRLASRLAIRVVWCAHSSRWDQPSVQLASTMLQVHVRGDFHKKGCHAGNPFRRHRMLDKLQIQLGGA